MPGGQLGPGKALRRARVISKRSWKDRLSDVIRPRRANHPTSMQCLYSKRLKVHRLIMSCPCFYLLLDYFRCDSFPYTPLDVTYFGMGTVYNPISKSTRPRLTLSL